MVVSLRARLLAVCLASALAFGAWAALPAAAPAGRIGAEAAAPASGWSNMTPSVSPVPMAGAMMAYSSRADRFVLFGGWDGVHGLNGTWVFDPANRTWTELHPPLVPTSRGDEMFVYDNRSDLFVLFGGWYEFPNGSYMRLSDTWTFSLTSGTWTERHPATSPSPRSDAEVAFDSRADAVLLVGGFSGTAYLGDVWTYFVGNDSWSPRPSATQPSARADGRMVYVAGQDRFVLFGGNDYSGPNFSFHHLDDTWAYSLSTNTWSVLASASPPTARDYPIFAVEGNSGMALLTSGYANGTILSDLWGLNLTTDVWSNLTPSSSPPDRFAGAGGYDSADGVLVVFSGAGDHGLLADTWYYGTATGGAPPNPVFMYAVVAFVVMVGAVAVAGLAYRTRRKRRSR